MNAIEISISAATDEERQDIVRLINTVAANLEATQVEIPNMQSVRKKVIDIDTLVTVLLQCTAAIGSGLVANAIYDKMKSKSQAPDSLHKNSTETEIEIVDESSGARIVVKLKQNNEYESARNDTL